MSLGTVPGAVELKLNGQKLAYVYYKKDENIIFSNYNCPAVIQAEANSAYVKGKCS